MESENFAWFPLQNSSIYDTITLSVSLCLLEIMFETWEFLSKSRGNFAHFLPGSLHSWP